MMAIIFNSAILDLAILVFPVKLTHTWLDWSQNWHKNTSLTLPSPPFVQKNFTHSFWLNLMMAAILNSAMLYSPTAILDTDTLFSSLRITQKHSLSPVWLWLKLI